MTQRQINNLRIIEPGWQVPACVKACTTTRQGGVSPAPYNSLNLATHVGDSAEHVHRNRQLLRETLKLPAEPRWLEQVHSVTVVDRSCIDRCPADAFYTTSPGEVAVVMTADCLPVLFANSSGSEVAAAHAGWKGLLDGVLEQTVSRFSSPPVDIQAWLGPAIGPACFEVGDDVRSAFVSRKPVQSHLTERAFRRQSEEKWLADIYELARIRLAEVGVTRVSGGEFCTVTDSQMFYSYRREKITGRMASLIWIEHD